MFDITDARCNHEDSTGTFTQWRRNWGSCSIQYSNCVHVLKYVGRSWISCPAEATAWNWRYWITFDTILTFQIILHYPYFVCHSTRNTELVDFTNRTVISHQVDFISLRSGTCSARRRRNSSVPGTVYCAAAFVLKLKPYYFFRLLIKFLIFLCVLVRTLRMIFLWFSLNGILFQFPFVSADLILGCTWSIHGRYSLFSTLDFKETMCGALRPLLIH